MAPARRNRKYVKRMLATAGSLAGLTLADSAEGKVIYVSDRPVTVKISADQYLGQGEVSGQVTWDIDGDGVGDFMLYGAYWLSRVSSGYRWNTTTEGGRFRTYRSVGRNHWGSALVGIKPFRGGDADRPAAGIRIHDTLGAKAIASSWVRPSDYFRAVPTHFTSWIWYFPSGFVRTSRFTLVSGVPYRSEFRERRWRGGPTFGFNFRQFAPGENLVGFRFYDDKGAHYGFAVFDMDFRTGNITISRWAYESAVGRPIHVRSAFGSVVPEPSSLALLATGAAGLLAYRARRKPKPDAPGDRDGAEPPNAGWSSASYASELTSSAL